MSNEAQIEYWNGEAGRKWAQRDAQMARLLEPVSAALLEHAQVGDARAAIDIGCGGGSGTRLLAERMADDACILGVDISEPLLDVARDALADDPVAGTHIGFLQADAAAHDFGEAQFDLLFSRFGVMFFDDPVAAFTHLHGSMLPGGRLAFCCWQALADNPWTALPLKAALSVLPAPAPPPPRAPGPFAFAERDYVVEILENAGWQGVEAAPRTIELTWPAGDGHASAVRELVNTGPVSRLLIEAAQAEREAVYAAASAALEDYVTDGALRLTGAVWLVTARARPNP